MRLKLRRISTDGGGPLPVHTAVGFGRGKGLSGKSHFPDGPVLAQQPIPQTGKLDVVSLGKTAFPPHLPLGQRPALAIQKMEYPHIIGDQLQGIVRIVVVGGYAVLDAGEIVFLPAQVH